MATSPLPLPGSWWHRDPEPPLPLRGSVSRWQRQALACTPGRGWLLHLAFCRCGITFFSSLILSATPAGGQDWPLRTPVPLVRSPRPAQPPGGLEAAGINCMLVLSPSAGLCSRCHACALPSSPLPLPPGQPLGVFLPRLTLLGATGRVTFCARRGSLHHVARRPPSHGYGPDFCRWDPGGGRVVKALHCWCAGKALGPFGKRHDTVWQEP